MSAYVVEKLPEGGFVVLDASFLRAPNIQASALFASASIGDALGFVRHKLEPEAKSAPDDCKQDASASLDVPPPGYRKLPANIRCRCLAMVEDRSGNRYCCKGGEAA